VIKLWLRRLLGHYLVTLWRDDWNDTTCDTRPRAPPGQRHKGL